MEGFKTHRLVGLGEVHNLKEHHDALGRLLTDPRLPGVADEIVVEFGDAFYQPMMDKFIIDGQSANNADLRLAWRNTTWLGSFDAGLSVGQPADLTQSCWNPAIFLDPAYWAELTPR